MQIMEKQLLKKKKERKGKMLVRTWRDRYPDVMADHPVRAFSYPFFLRSLKKNVGVSAFGGKGEGGKGDGCCEALEILIVGILDML
jgi:hypothetical protein